MAPQNATCAWLLAVLATAIVVAPRLAAERAVLVSPARLELQLAALALGGTQRQAARLAAAADPAGPTLLLRGLALAATKGMAALALWRIVGAHELVLEGVAMLQERGGIALSLVVILAAPAASRPARSRRASVRRMFRAPTAPHLEATP